MVKVLLAIFVGMFRRRPTPLDSERGGPEGAEPGAAVAGATGERPVEGG
jgi:hypothetical protein